MKNKVVIVSDWYTPTKTCTWEEMKVYALDKFCLTEEDAQ